MRIEKSLLLDRKNSIDFIKSIFPKQFKLDFNIQLVEDMGGRFYTLTDPISKDHIIRIKLLFLSAVQQFQFWVSPKDTSLRTGISSSVIHELTYLDNFNEYKNQMETVLNKAAYLRQERFELFEKSWNYLSEYRDPILIVSNGSMGTSLLKEIDDLLVYLYDFPGFKTDVFGKKKNYFMMSVIRYFTRVLEETKNVEFESIIKLNPNPAIDYNIPPILDKIGIITLPSEIKKMINYNVVFPTNNFSELLIRSYSYIAMIKFEAKTKLNQEVLDGNLFFNRKGFKINPLLCMTVNY